MRNRCRKLYSEEMASISSGHNSGSTSPRPSRRDRDVTETVVIDALGDTPHYSHLQTSRSVDDGGIPGALPVPPVRPSSCGDSIRRLLNLSITHANETRVVPFGCDPLVWSAQGYPSNAVNNRRFSLLTFLPLALLNQFRNFFNVFYLFLAFSQLIPLFKVGFLFTYFSPLAMVVCLSLMKDALDEFKRYRRDRAVNREYFEKITRGGDIVKVRSSDIRVGDLLMLHHDQRIPADCVLLHTSEANGTMFVRTDQLDGETDWKLRYPLNTSKGLSYTQLGFLRVNLRCEAPHKDIYQFVGVLDNANGQSEAIGAENCLWASCVVASGTCVGAVMYTGTDTRSAMNATKPRTKWGLIEDELNFIGFLCFTLLLIFSFLLVAQQRFHGDWVVMLIRFLILMSAMIPISMRVNVDVGRLWYSYDIGRDPHIPGTVARNTDLPEELGRLQYLFSDKTGTLTKNSMQFRVLQLGQELVLTDRDIDRIEYDVQEYFGSSSANAQVDGKFTEQKQQQRERIRRSAIAGDQRQRDREVQAVGEMVSTMVLCHNVSPVLEDGQREYQASSLDEVALVRFCSSVGVTLNARDLGSVSFTVPSGEQYMYDVVKMFPFTSERKCMGVIVKRRRLQTSGEQPGSSPLPAAEYVYYMKGADTKMTTVVRSSEWLDESCQELAQVGLRTLVFASRALTEEQLLHFLQQYDAASAIMGETRGERLEAAMRLLETDMTLVGVTGVEDELQDNVVEALETLGMCGIKVWILTGDKVETATTIGRSTRLIPRNAPVEYLLCTDVEELWGRLGQLQRQYDPAIVGDYMLAPWTLILDGTCLSLCLLPQVEQLFVEVARTAYSVIVARCSPTQKAKVVETMRAFSKKTVRMAAIGDGGNDVSMILAANVGIGIEGVEGKQASMAADFSITKFSHCLRLIMWHGRNSYRRTCRLSQFIMHRGIVYSVVQAVFSTLFAGTTMSVFNGYLLMGYSTVFTMAPAFALVLDEDFKETDVGEYPQLYRELIKSRSMNTRTFLEWVWVSLFQGGVMMLVSLQLFNDEMFQIVTIAYTSLLITELVIVGSTVHLRQLWSQRRWHFWLFIAAEAISLLAFFLAVVVLPDTFDRVFFFSWSCWWRVAVICCVSIGPLLIFRLLGKYILFNRRIAEKFM